MLLLQIREPVTARICSLRMGSQSRKIIDLKFGTAHLFVHISDKILVIIPQL